MSRGRSPDHEGTVARRPAVRRRADGGRCVQNARFPSVVSAAERVPGNGTYRAVGHRSRSVRGYDGDGADLRVTRSFRSTAEDCAGDESRPPYASDSVRRFASAGVRQGDDGGVLRARDGGLCREEGGAVSRGDGEGVSDVQPKPDVGGPPQACRAPSDLVGVLIADDDVERPARR